MPQRLPAFAVGRVGADQAGDDGARNLAAVNVRPVQEVEVVIGIDMGAGLQADDGAEAFGMFERSSSSAEGWAALFGSVATSRRVLVMRR